METTSGRPITAMVGFRVSLNAYRVIIDRARAEGITVSRLLRRITLGGLGIELPAADREESDES